MVPCALTSGAIGTCCGSACVDTTSDTQFCGSCGVTCGPSHFCVGGSCLPSPTCAAGNDGVACPLGDGGVGACCADSCVNPQFDATSCGACGVECPAGDLCSQGGCRAPDGGSGGCSVVQSCREDAVCIGGSCLLATCGPGVTGAACAFGAADGASNGGGRGTCCSGACVDEAQDPANCSACGEICSGVCANDGAGAVICASTTSTQPNCPFDCTLGQEVCVGTQCLPPGCEGGPGACTPDGVTVGLCCDLFGSTTCNNILTDPHNCGGCNVMCPPGQTCSQGVCSGAIAPCLAGHVGEFCNRDAGLSYVCCAGGGCTDLETDPQNCGSCGFDCGTLGCAAGACQ